MKGEAAEKEKEKERKKNRRELESYVDLIQALDSFRAFRSLDPRRIERYVLKTGSEDFRRRYHSIEGDLKRMAYYPAKVPEMRGMYRWMTLAKFLAVIASVFVAGVSFVALERPTMIGAAFGNPVLLAMGILLPVVGFNFAVISEFRMRRRLSKIYQGKFSAERSRMGAVIQYLINVLNEKVGQFGEDPKKYKLSLYHEDYKA